MLRETIFSKIALNIYFLVTLVGDFYTNKFFTICSGMSYMAGRVEYLKYRITMGSPMQNPMQLKSFEKYF
jgi:hypothetical protein